MSTFYVDELRFYRHENVEMSINCDFIDIIEKFYEIPVRTACVSGRSEGGFTTEATEITERIAEHRVAATPRVSTVCDGTRTPSSAASEPPSTERRTPSAICATHADR